MGYPLKDKRTIAVLNVFIEIVNKCKHKPNKLRVDQWRECHNSAIQKWLNDNDFSMYCTHNKHKSIVAARLKRIFKTKISKKVTPNIKKSWRNY